MKGAKRYNKQEIRKRCLYCRNFFVGSFPKQYCSDKCRRDNWVEKTSKINDKKILDGISAPTKGAISELLVSWDLMSKGYNVFRALSPACSCDLLIFKRNKIYKVEVTSGWMNKSGRLYTNKKKIESNKNDVVATVYLNSKIVYIPTLEELFK